MIPDLPSRVAERWRQTEEYLAEPQHRSSHAFRELLPLVKADPVLGRLSPFMSMDGLCLSRCTEIPGYVDLLFGVWGDNEYIVMITDGHGHWTKGLPLGEGDAQSAVRMAREFLTDGYPAAVVANAFEIAPGLENDPVTVRLRAARPRLERCTSPLDRGWLELRHRLWPHCSRQEHELETRSICGNGDRLAAFVAYGYAGTPLGFIETSTRVDYVNGTSTSPVGFIEGLYVIEAARFRGIGRMLVQAGEGWARERGCREMASDALIGNESGHDVHRRLGFQETERVVYFRKDL